jgi:phospholipid/cholesterol/gamma-HCH transport system permease protein
VREGLIESIGRFTIEHIELVGDLALFTWNMLGWLLARRLRPGVLLPNLHEIGIRSIPVVIVTGAFLGMVMSVQTYDQLRDMRIENTLGTVINLSLVKELGPVLAATMLAGRVGSSMAAELGTMRITEQIDALRVLGANPLHYLVVPRFLGCTLLIPLLSVVADCAGIVGGWFFSTQVLDITSIHYWHHANSIVTVFDFCSGIVKSCFFGAAIGIVACHRGFHCDAGAEGVGRAATEAFVYSFVSILVLDFFLGVTLTSLQHLLHHWHTHTALILPTTGWC